MMKPAAAFAVCLIGISIGCFFIGPYGLKNSFQAHNDFRAFYIGGRLAGGDRLYDANAALAAQQQTLGEGNVHMLMVRPPFYYVFVAPLARLPYRTAWLLWVLGEVLAAVLFVCLYSAADRTALAKVCCLEASLPGRTLPFCC
jgi:hypothetical protein